MARYIHEITNQDKIEVDVMTNDEADLFDDLWPVGDCLD